MPREDRRIIFDYSETYKAIYALSVQKDMRKPPPGTIKGLMPDPENEETIKVRIVNPHDNTSDEKEYSRDFLAAALMLYCRSQNIPLAKKSQKSVELGTETVILRIMI